jgi:hypothetical protein
MAHCPTDVGCGPKGFPGPHPMGVEQAPDERDGMTTIAMNDAFVNAGRA